VLAGTEINNKPQHTTRLKHRIQFNQHILTKRSGYPPIALHTRTDTIALRPSNTSRLYPCFYRSRALPPTIPSRPTRLKQKTHIILINLRAENCESSIVPSIAGDIAGSSVAKHQSDEARGAGGVCPEFLLYLRSLQSLRCLTIPGV
jgi:hypothetical protein